MESSGVIGAISSTESTGSTVSTGTTGSSDAPESMGVISIGGSCNVSSPSGQGGKFGSIATHFFTWESKYGYSGISAQSSAEDGLEGTMTSL
jgi:hypothetical protein